MALTDLQIKQLDVANQRVEAAKTAGADLSSYATDMKNIEYAKTKGYAPTSVNAATPTSNPTVTPAQPDNNHPAGSPASPDANKAASAPEVKPTDNAKVLNDTQNTAAGIDTLIASGRVFNEVDAKNYAYSKGETNYQQYIGGSGGQANPLYIGNTNWANLQKQYTPYQLQQATTRTKDGIYWRSDVNIGDFSRSDPADLANSDSNIISDIITSAKDDADKVFGGDDKYSGKPDLSADVDENNDNLMKMLQTQYGSSAESLYNELFKTPEMEEAQTKVTDLVAELDEYDQQLEELKGDIRKEVEGEASDSYITALATIRGENILKMKRSTQREYDTALSQLNSLKEEATNLLNVRVKDADTRYTRMFSMLQLQLQQEGNEFNQQIALVNASMSIPEGRSVQIGDYTVKGMKENDNLNIVSITDADRNMYVVGVDKKTGEEKYRTFLGKAAASGSTTNNTFQYKYAEEVAETKLEQLQKVNTGLAKPTSEDGAIRTDVDENNDTFYYDAYKYEQAVANDTASKGLGDLFGLNNPDKLDYLLYYAK